MSTANYAKHLCPIAQALVDLGDQWTLLIVRDALSQKQVRFNELQENLGISRNLLTRRLNQLCEAGILEKVAVEGSKRFAYEPTEKCRDLRLVIHAMARWGEVAPRPAADAGRDHREDDRQAGGADLRADRGRGCGRPCRRAGGAAAALRPPAGVRRRPGCARPGASRAPAGARRR
ncbi:winged helix-turn-helix transcriptional regulator [Seohaeicola zhoushanensis]